MDSEPDEFSIFELTTRFDISMIDLSTLQGVINDKSNGAPRTSYGLGSGVSCSVFLHETTIEEDGSPRGKLIEPLTSLKNAPGSD